VLKTDYKTPQRNTLLGLNRATASLAVACYSVVKELNSGLVPRDWWLVKNQQALKLDSKRETQKKPLYPCTNLRVSFENGTLTTRDF
jgi:hypothetical protein